MLFKCKQSDQMSIWDYIGTDYPFCLYIYLNINKYGLESEMIEVYLQKRDDVITSILLKYYSCLHVYSKDNCFDADEVVAFFEKRGCTMLYCTKQIGETITMALTESLKKKSIITNGWLAQILEVDKKPQGLAIRAKANDFDQIVSLIYEDEDIGKSYKFDELSKQIEERNMEGYARNIVIKIGDLVIAHACTNAEVKNISIVAELLVRNGFRGKGYGSEIWRDICNELLSEGKEVYSFYYSKESRALHKHIGFFEICEWTKIVIV